MGTSVRYFSLAATAAVFLHVLLLSQSIEVRQASVIEEKPLSVSILEEKDPELIAEVKPIAKPIVEAKPIVVKPKTRPQLLDELIVATKPGAQPRSKVKVQTNLQSKHFKNWLKSETDNFTNTNPATLGKFDETFTVAPFEGSPPELSPFYKTSATRGSTTFSQEYKGKRTCIVKILNLLDVASGPSYTTRDCTPKKKFDLKLNQPNNGWSDR